MRVVLEDFRKNIPDLEFDKIHIDKPHVIDIDGPVAIINGELK